MPNGLVSLGYLRLQAQQRADMENNPAISTPEWNQYISSSYKELYDLLVAAYGDDYYIALPYQFALTGSQFYPLPTGSSTFQLPNNQGTAPAFYKLAGMDLQYSSSPTGWVSLGRFEMIERNKYSNPNTAINFLGYTNLRYRISGGNLWMIPIPASAQAAQIWYVPEPTSLQFAPTCATVANSTTVTCSDVSGLSAGMTCYGSLGITDGTTVVSIDTSLNTVVLSVAPSLTMPITTLIFWTDAVTIDGISGWEEFVIVDAAIKAGIKQENSIDGLAGQKAAMVKRIEAMAPGRDVGQAQHVSDALAINGMGGDGFGSDGWGNGGGYGGY